MKIGDEVYVHGYVDEIRKDVVIVRNEGGYFGTVPSEVIDIVRCKECKWYDPPHILHKDGTRTDVDEDAPWVTVDVGINCGGQCIHHIDLKTYCVNHDRENPDDNERIVIFRKPDDFCSYGEREGE